MENNENKNPLINTNIKNNSNPSIIDLNTISYGPNGTTLNKIGSYSLNLGNISNNSSIFNNKTIFTSLINQNFFDNKTKASSKMTTLGTFINTIDNTEIKKSLIEQIKSEGIISNYNNTVNTFNNQSFSKNNIGTSLFNSNPNITKINKTFFDNSSNNLNISNNPNQSNSILTENKINFANYTLYIGIICPILLIIICIIYCFIKRRKKSSMNNHEINDLNRINFKNSAQKIPYNKLQNTSGINNVNVNPNNISMSEIKVQNLKDEIHDIITNSSGSSSSSGRRKRDKKKSGNSNKIPGYSGQEGNKGVQNNIKEEIKQYVIDENSNK
jgi:uncharacterized membrane protein